MKFFSSLAFRAAVTAALLVLVALQVDWADAVDRAGEVDGGWLAAAIGLTLGMQISGVIRWQLLVRAAGIESPPPRTVRAYWIGIFTNNVLPTGFGGDAARAFIVGRDSGQMVPAATSVAFDRLTGLAALIVLAWVALVLGEEVPAELSGALALVTAASLGGGLLLALAFRGRGRLGRLVPERLRGWGREARETLTRYARDGRLLAVAGVLGILYQLCAVGSIAALAEGIGLDLSFAVVAVTVCLVLLASVLPISIAGFGVREASFVVLLGEAGVGATEATLLSLLSVVPLVLVSLPGGLALLRAPASER